MITTISLMITSAVIGFVSGVVVGYKKAKNIK